MNDIDTFKEEIKKAAYNKYYSVKRVEKLIEKMFVRKPVPIVEANYSFLGRGRYNMGGEIFNNVSQLSYNPKKSKIKLLRCNQPKQQVFYGALPAAARTEATVLFEVALEQIKNPKEKYHYITMSRWIIARPLNIILLPFSKLSQQKNSTLKVAEDNYVGMIQKYAADFNLSFDFLMGCLEYISDIFCIHTDKLNWYKISAAYYNFVMDYATKTGIAVDGLVYPSSNTENEGLNIALKPDLIDSKALYCDSVVMYKGTKNARNDKHFSFVDASDTAIVKPDGSFEFKYVI